MTNRLDDGTPEDQDLSALADGELGSAAVARLCRQWRNEPGLRQRWYQYHAIGDVLRSEDLASTAAHDNDFLTLLRARLASEPIIMAPLEHHAATPGAVRAQFGRRRLASVGAIAAGFMVVAVGALGIFGQPFTGNAPQSLTAGGIAAQPVPALIVATRSPVQGDLVGELLPTVASGQLIRDAKLDSYLSAHRQWSNGAMLGGHAAYLRSNSGDGVNR